MSVDKAALLVARLGQREVPIPGLGSVTVRGISHGEAQSIQAVPEGIERQAATVALALVDPVLTPEEVTAWMAAAPAGEIDRVSTAIGELSGLLESSQKDAYKSNGGKRRS